MLIELMGKGKRRSSCDDEQALIKAAAWAWYQHGSGNEGKPMRESDAATAPRQPRPSRYKLEAIAKAAAVANDAKSRLPGSSPAAQSPAHADNSLLDGYEIERITRHLNRLIVTGRGGDFSVAGARSRRKQYGCPPPGKATPAKVGRFWIRHVVGLCASRADVAEARVLVGGCRPVPRVGR